MRHVGIDVHQKYSEICEISEEGKVLHRAQIPTTESGLRKFFARRDRRQVVMESGSLTPWVHRLLNQYGHQVVVVNPRRVRLIAESTLKTDAIDAEILARLSRFDPELLHQVYQRSEAAQVLRSRLRVRGALVKSRTALINTVRGVLRSQGYRVRSSTSARFVAHFVEAKIPQELRQLLDPLLETLVTLTEQIGGIDKELQEMAKEDELLQRLQSVPGVGPLVSIAYVAWMDRAERFDSSRDVGACLGLRPSSRDSGGRSHHGSITREGDSEMRRLLVQAAHASLRCRQDSALKRWAMQLIERKGTGKGVVALGRKISVLLHRLWVTGQSFEAFPKGV